MSNVPPPGMWSTEHPHMQSWSMMQSWGVIERPAWQRDYIERINASVQAALRRRAFG